MKEIPISQQPKSNKLPALACSELALGLQETGNALAGMLKGRSGTPQPITETETRRSLYDDDFNDDDHPIEEAPAALKPKVRTLADLARIKPHQVPEPKPQPSYRPAPPPRPVERAPTPAPAPVPVLQESTTGPSTSSIAAALFRRK